MKQRLLKQKGLPFTQVPNQLLTDKNISLKAKGIFAFMFSKPENWVFTIGSMSKQLKEGRDGIASALRELKTFGWVNYNKLPDGRGEYFMYYESIIKKPNTDFPIEGKNHNRKTPQRENATMGKPVPFSNTDLINNKELNNNTNIKLHSENKFSADVVETFEFILNLFPFHLHPKTQKEISSWRSTIDKLNRIDGFDFKQIYHITKLARENIFWSKNFLSILKLRKKSKDGILYIIVFNELFNQQKNEQQRISRQTESTIKSNIKGW